MRHCPGPALAGILLLATAAAPAPNGAIVDYERTPPTFGGVPSERHYQSGSAVRIDQRIVQAQTNFIFLVQRFTRPGQTFTFETIHAEDGRLLGVSAMDDPFASPPPAALRQWVGRVERYLGERCRVWRASRLGGSFVQSGCATADGIDLRRKQDRIDTIFATRVRRVAISAGSVRLPLEALDTAALIRAGVGTDHAHDYEAVLEGLHGRSALFRRSGNWRYVEEKGNGSVRVRIQNSATGAAIRYSRDPDGTRRLAWSQPPLITETHGDDYRGEPIPDMPGHTILGERCMMRNMMPKVSDASRIDCRTDDNVPLSISWPSVPSSSRLAATRFSRAPLSPDKVMLPAAVTGAAAWLKR